MLAGIRGWSCSNFFQASTVTFAVKVETKGSYILNPEFNPELEQRVPEPRLQTCRVRVPMVASFNWGFVSWVPLQ